MPEKSERSLNTRSLLKKNLMSKVFQHRQSSRPCEKAVQMAAIIVAPTIKKEHIMKSPLEENSLTKIIVTDF